MRRKNNGLNNRIPLLVSVFYLAAAVVLINVGIVSYNYYRKDLIATEQNELLMMAETIGQSLVNYVEQELDGIELCCLMMEMDGQEPERAHMEQILRHYLEEKEELYTAVAYVDEKGQPDLLYGTMDFSADMLTDEEGAVICGKGITDKGWYQLYISRKFHGKNGGGFLVYAMDLNEIYQKIVASVRIGEGGYSIVKDGDLSIIMHHAKNQIGMDAVYDRSEQYPDLDLEDLTAWLELQRTQPEGVGMIHTYVWDDPGLTPVERIVAYTTIELPGETWIVNSTLPYKEIEGPLWLMLRRLMGICLVFIGFLSVFIIIITRDLMQSRSQKKEIRYLREINEGMELLRHKEEEIRHYQRVQTIGQMSSHIAHEFNNYLTPVMVYAELLEADAEMGEENRKLVQGILRSTNQAADLSRKLLDFSRQETSVMLVPVSLTKDVETALQMIRQLAPQKISVESRLDSRPLYIQGQEGMVEHILMNLCNNAFHAMEKTGGVLTVCLAPASPKDCRAGVFVNGTEELPPGNWVVLSVRDTGCGMEEEIVNNIFEPFFTTKGRGKGTGLGLSVIHNLIVAAGGAIRVDTKPGEGTAFYLFFPELAEEEMEEEAKGRKSKPYGAKSGSLPQEHKVTDVPAGISGQRKLPEMKIRRAVVVDEKQWLTKNRRVIVVDDDPEILESMKAMFKSSGYHYEGFRHPAAVISKIQRHPDYCDLILTDYSMPYMNGVELCELVRKLNPHIRLVLMSGAADMRFEWYLKNAFIDEFVLKSDLAGRFAEVFQPE